MFLIVKELELEKLMDVETDRVTERDKKDYILIGMTEDERNRLVSKEERKGLNNISGEYRLEVKRVPLDSFVKEY